jgi:hypothetical protein
VLLVVLAALEVALEAAAFEAAAVDSVCFTAFAAGREVGLLSDPPTAP